MDFFKFGIKFVSTYLSLESPCGNSKEGDSLCVDNVWSLNQCDSKVKRNQKQGFSLVELLVAIGIVTVLLVMGAALFRNSGQSESRQAARSLILAGLNAAQTKALASGEPVALVMMPYEQGWEGQLGRAFTLFEVRRDDVTGDFVAGEQIRRWTQLPGRFIFSKGTTVSSAGQNAFHEDPVVNVTVRDKRGGQVRADMPAIIFGGSGAVLWPAGSGELELHLMEGAVRNNMAVGVESQMSDWASREVFVIGRQTGRARFLQTR